MSQAIFKTTDLNPVGRFIINVFHTLCLINVEHGIGEDNQFTSINNFTIINFVIKILGPLHERTLVCVILGIQVRDLEEFLPCVPTYSYYGENIASVKFH